MTGFVVALLFDEVGQTLTEFHAADFKERWPRRVEDGLPPVLLPRRQEKRPGFQGVPPSPSTALRLSPRCFSSAGFGSPWWRRPISEGDGPSPADPARRPFRRGNINLAEPIYEVNDSTIDTQHIIWHTLPR